MATSKREASNGNGPVAESLSAHSLLGITASALLYIVVLSGTLAVFYAELERWEQPEAPEFLEYSAGALQRAASSGWQAANRPADDEPLYVALPYPDLPRLVVSVGDESWVANRAGSLVASAAHDWTHFLIYLHIYLNLPPVIGFVLVGIIGVLLTALIVSGFIAHPRIFRDAFRFRFNRGGRLREVDLHNRLSVWASPFHLVIAVTGAFVGLSSVILFAMAQVFHDGDLEAARASAYGPEPASDHRAASFPDLAAALTHLRRTEPEAVPYFVVVHDPGTRGQRVQINAKLTDRLVYAEIYRYDAAGNFLGTEGLSDGPAGKQIYASSFPVHFGSFGGMPVRIAYLLLGLCMTVVCVSGVNIYLLRRRQRGAPVPWAERVWPALVWSVPLGLSLSLLLHLLLGAPPAWVFWIATASGPIAAAVSPLRADALRLATVLTVGLILLARGIEYGAGMAAPAALPVNLLLVALAMLAGGGYLFRKFSGRPGRSHGIETSLPELDNVT